MAGGIRARSAIRPRWLINGFLLLLVVLTAAACGGPRKIAFQSDRNGNLEIYVMNADGSNQVNLTNNRVTDGSPDW